MALHPIPPSVRLTKIGRCTRGWEDLNVQALADAVGISAYTIRQVLTGRKSTSVSTLRRLSAALEMRLVDVVKRIEDAEQADKKARASKIIKTTKGE